MHGSEKYVPNREKIRATHQAVAACFSYEGALFGIPVQQEDQTKFEAVFTGDGEISSSRYLRDTSIGILGGQVEEDESFEEALVREITSELAEALNKPEDFVRDVILPKCDIGALRQVENFLVLQAVQDDQTKDHTPRGMFEVSISIVALSDEGYVLLANSLRRIGAESEETLRPFVRELFRRGEFTSREQGVVLLAGSSEAAGPFS